jgi:hypothetical protein
MWALEGACFLKYFLTLIAKSLARLKGKVIGLDACQNSIRIAENHKSEEISLQENLCYMHKTAGIPILLTKREFS